MLEILDTKEASASKNMLIDKDLFSSLYKKTHPILHLYDWENDSFTYGHFTLIENFINTENAKKLKIDFAKRPTGGGIVFHSFDLAFSVLVPKSCKFYSSITINNYNFINKLVLKVINKILKEEKLELFKIDNYKPKNIFSNFCMANKTKYDVIFKEKKIAGAAQRRNENGYLHQGSIFIAMPKKAFLKNILNKNAEDIIDEIYLNTASILQMDYTAADIKEIREKIKKQLIQEFKKTFNDFL